MKFSNFVASLCLPLILLVFSEAVFGEEGRIFIQPKKNLTEYERNVLKRLLEKYQLRLPENAKPMHARHPSSILSIKVDKKFECLKELKQSGLIQDVEEDQLVPMANIPNDPLVGDQWHHQTLNTFDAWDFSRGEGVLVAVCDSGFDPEHEDLKSQYELPGFNTVDNSSDFSDVNLHGTAVAGLISASVNNSGGVGIAPQSRLLPIRVSNRSDGSAFISDLADCVYYATDRGAKVINVSYSGAESMAIAEAAKYAKDRGSLLVFTAGNENRDISRFPDDPNFLIVGATDRRDNRSSFSNFGTAVDIVAPGTQVLTTTLTTFGNRNRYAPISGTSFASPIVAAAATLVYSVNSNFSNREVQEILLSTTRNVGSEFEFGEGLLDISAAVAEAVDRIGGNVPDEPTPAPTPEPEVEAYVKGLQILSFKQGRDTISFVVGRLVDKNGKGIFEASLSVSIGNRRTVDIESSEGGYFQYDYKGNDRGVSVITNTVKRNGRLINFK
jgi:thermitase